MDERSLIEERLRAYIHPNAPRTDEQRQAFDAAVDAQLDWESGQDAANLPGNVKSYSIGSYSVTLSEAAGGACAQASVCPGAWAILFNAGLLSRALPAARRL